jgi:Leucine-rich repeat (LRR) protein
MPSTATLSARRKWWMSLEPQWKLAFQTSVLIHTDTPTDHELDNMMSLTSFSCLGASAQYPTVDFELTNLSGLKELSELETLVLTHHKLTDVSGLEGLKYLKNVFLSNNEITSLRGIENLRKLEQLNVQNNKIESLLPLKLLTNMKELYVNFNALISFEGVTLAHSKCLKMFHCLPCERMSFKDIIFFEQAMGVRCEGKRA